MSVFLETNHLFLRNPRGGVEHVQMMKDAGFGAIFCNVKDYLPEEWALVRERAEAAEVVCGPWLRTVMTGSANEPFDPNLLDFLLATADAWQQPLIVNSESELKGTGDDLTEYIAQQCAGRDWALSMEPWPFANVDWTPIDVPVLPQIFGERWAADAEAAREEWYRVGVNCVVSTFGAYDGMTPSHYDRLSPYGVYTADDVGLAIDQWSPIGTRYPCASVPAPQPPGGDMEKIGPDHGITAFVDWLQAQPNMPARKPGYDPANPNTWPWPERIERTLTILAKDHDQAAG